MQCFANRSKYERIVFPRVDVEMTEPGYLTLWTDIWPKELTLAWLIPRWAPHRVSFATPYNNVQIGKRRFRQLWLYSWEHICCGSRNTWTFKFRTY